MAPVPEEPVKLTQPLPVEIEVYVNPDGSVTFADLAEDMVAVAHRLNPDEALVCDVTNTDDDAPVDKAPL